MKSDELVSALVEYIGKTSSLFWSYAWNLNVVRYKTNWMLKQPISVQPMYFITAST